MKKLFIVLFLVLSVFTAYTVSDYTSIINVNADSGWDNDYGGSDFGGSDYSGSDWSSSDSSGGSGGGSLIGFLIVLGVFIIIIGISVIYEKLNSGNKKSKLLAKIFLFSIVSILYIVIVPIFIFLFYWIIPLFVFYILISFAIFGYILICFNFFNHVLYNKIMDKLIPVLIGIGILFLVVFAISMIVVVVMAFHEDVFAGSFMLFIVLFTIIASIYPSMISTRNRKGKTFNSLCMEIIDNQNKEIFDKYYKHSMEDEIYNKFVDVQKAWMNFDYDNLKKLCSSELYESYKSDLEILNSKNEKNIMKNFHLVKCKVCNIKESSNNIIVTAVLWVTFNDYVQNMKTLDIVRGDRLTKYRNIYKLEFIRSKEVIDKCPSCGAELTSSECSYCHTIINNRNTELVLTNKELRK